MTKIYEATRAHHFIQKLKALTTLTHNAETKQRQAQEALYEIETFVNNILKELATQEQQDE